jgi:hypothetical protein
MKNKISDLRNHMFAALERLGNENISPEDLQKEIERSRAISEVGKVIVESAKTEVLYAKMTGKRQDEPTHFLEEDVQPLKIDRPKAEYSNKKHAI